MLEKTMDSPVLSILLIFNNLIFSFSNLFRGPYYFQQKNRRGHCERIKRCHRRQYDMCQGHLESRHACAVIPNTNQLPIDPSLRAGSELHNRVYYYTKV